ncbi:hypothetical protein SO802_012505 [Lithocarpus litseifolius]|uniref:Uncharacterized protein n=1 Tax=Lithocarpus litseifolius TaxID=425828 RepID=A0AAW2D5L8_9ROSI
MEEQSYILKKMGSCLTKLEEAKLKKTTYVEIRGDEVREGWDERNKQFEKLTKDTMAMREKMEKIQLAFRKAQGMDDYLCSMGGISDSDDDNGNDDDNDDDDDGGRGTSNFETTPSYQLRKKCHQ